MQVLNTLPQATGLLRLATAARMAGLTPDAMRAALTRQEIPISRVRLGRLTFVKAAELHSWLTAPTPATPATPATATTDLFR